ncbi:MULTISPECIES: VOC family protein [Stenotrophomonas]|jgi:catechol 2,3-dioxygenase-like lactoylglutathione lyase family enzyme|uniref:VOC family protein n=1 Tax=Stenotrophomonas TaxID=40323 RepID=UPI00066B511B|nr:VOC family protein [Stenotrophomonas geniculata]KPG68957.1 drug:proton antiporter [Stenotrophomonas maltophilia]MBA0242402.1 drug:proton antiporter [Stenotrophomonas maltophilia]MBA0247631.1 drug:proton antiporter [Stenotrophomonas maltophilia]MBA0306698.1 drug:proton antiporter [Stenotrophomonas maltophilia]MBA0438559.1 drug:proton antiporter [Stenotrophomonas maltophilia]
MFKPSTLLQYVRDVAASATFYSGILGKPPVEQSPGFALFLLGDGAALGLWQRDDVQPAVSAQAGAAELAMLVAKPETVQQTHDAWRALGVQILQAPVTLEFGHTFVGVDPDGHRLRVYSRAEGMVARD